MKAWFRRLSPSWLAVLVSYVVLTLWLVFRAITGIGDGWPWWLLFLFDGALVWVCSRIGRYVGEVRQARLDGEVAERDMGDMIRRFERG